MTDARVRPVRPEDAEALAEVRRRPGVARYTSGVPSTRAAEVDGRAVGYPGLHQHPSKLRHTAWLGVAVHDAHQGRGLGRSLLDVADNHLGLVRVDLEVDPASVR